MTNDETRRTIDRIVAAGEDTRVRAIVRDAERLSGIAMRRCASDGCTSQVQAAAPEGARCVLCVRYGAPGAEGRSPGERDWERGRTSTESEDDIT